MSGAYVSAESEVVSTRRWLSAEFAIGILVMLVPAIFAYGQLYGDVGDNKKNVEQIQQDSARQTSDVQKIKVDVEVIKTNLQNINTNVEKAAAKSESNSEVLQQILRRLPAED